MTTPRAWLEDRLVAGLDRWWGDERLTVLAYHRIVDPHGFRFFEPLISATPDTFARQMNIIAEECNVIDLAELLGWLDGSGTLPERAALITFDDGYRDNLEFALPVLRERGLPAVLFVTTDQIGTDHPFFWDAAAYYFDETTRRHADLPILGPRSWSSPSEMCAEWIEAAKRVPQNRRNEATEQLAEALDTEMPKDAYSGQLLTWDEIREMSEHGFSFGSHTCTHPILTGIPAPQVAEELERSRVRLEEELRTPIRSFAYPNGSPSDFNPDIEEIALRAGYSASFTLVPGPTRSREVQERPAAIRRIGVYLSDSERRFRAKLAGAGRARSTLA